jgi:hypothetical protein
MVRMNRRLWVAASMVLACRGACDRDVSSAPSTAPAEPRQAPSIDAGVALSASAGVTESDAAPTVTACPRYADAMSRAVRATTEHRYADADAAYDQALKVKPFDARAWAEKGYARMLAGDAKAAYEALETARSLTKTRALLATIWFNEGELAARAGDASTARLRYALAASFGSAAGASKIAGQSQCRATWTTSVAAMPIVRGWTGVLAAMPQATCAEHRTPQTTEAAAHREACRGCRGFSDPLDDAGCSGPGPWTIPNGYMMCHGFDVVVDPIGGNRFLVLDSNEPEYATTASGFVRHASSSAGFSVEPTPWEVMSGSKDADGCTVDVSAEVELDMPQHCQAGEAYPPIAGPDEVTYWDASGKARLKVSYWDEEPSVAFAGARAHVTGAGCDDFVTLP